jgi:hypothetical protein
MPPGAVGAAPEAMPPGAVGAELAKSRDTGVGDGALGDSEELMESEAFGVDTRFPIH